MRESGFSTLTLPHHVVRLPDEFPGESGHQPRLRLPVPELKVVLQRIFGIRIRPVNAGGKPVPIPRPFATAYTVSPAGSRGDNTYASGTCGRRCFRIREINTQCLPFAERGRRRVRHLGFPPHTCRQRHDGCCQMFKIRGGSIPAVRLCRLVFHRDNILIDGRQPVRPMPAQLGIKTKRDIRRIHPGRRLRQFYPMVPGLPVSKDRAGACGLVGPV